MARNTIQDIPFKFPMDEAQVELLFQSCLEDKLDEIINGKKEAEEKLKEQYKNEALIQEKELQIQAQDLEIKKLRQLLKQHGISLH